MSGPLRVFPDAKAAVATLIGQGLSAHPKAYTTGAVVVDRVPTAETIPAILLGIDSRRHVVRGEATGWGQPVMSTVTIRVTVWHADADQANDLASLVQGWILSNTGPDIQSITPGIGPLPGVDTSSIPFETFTVLAVLKAADLT